MFGCTKVGDTLKVKKGWGRKEERKEVCCAEISNLEKKSSNGTLIIPSFSALNKKEIHKGRSRVN